MKFETKFGIGEIVMHSLVGHKNAKHSDFLEVVAIQIDKAGPAYICRYPHGVTSIFHETDLVGDPDFDQDKGAYDYDIRGCDD